MPASRTSTLHRMLLTVAAGALLAPIAATPAYAEEDDDVVFEPFSIPIITSTGSTGSTGTVIEVDNSGVVLIQTGEGEGLPRSGCYPGQIEPGVASATPTTCIGQPSLVDPTSTPLTVGTTSDFLASNGADHLSALGWLVREGVESVAALYDLPYDGRVSRYAGDQVRAHVVARILDILDKSLYGQPLTADEQKTLDYINQNFLKTDQKIARWANQEYEAFLAQGCGYAPAPAPSFVVDPVALPQTVVDWCARRHTPLENTFVFAPPLPSADHFQAWGLYRNIAELGLDRLSSPELQKSMGDTYRAVFALSGMAAAAGGAVVAGAAVGGSVAASAAVAAAVGSSAASASFGVSTTAAATALGTFGAIAGASIVATVILAVVVTAIAIWQLVEYEEVGVTLRQRVADADKAAEPFGLDEISSQFVGKELRSGLTPANLPPYRTAASISRIVEIVTGVTTAKYSGVYVPDPDELWPDNATTDDDFRFFITDSAGSRLANVLEIPVDGVDTTVRFSKGWMVVDTGDGEKPALEFGYVDPDGARVLVTRAPASVGGFTVTRADGTNPLESESREEIEFEDAEGELVSVRLVGQSTSGLGGPLPSAVGPLTPGRTVILRPNPVDEAGNFNLDRFVTGYDYTWTLQRLDAESGVWSDVGEPIVGYDARVIPTETGSYRAGVRMTDTDPTDGIDDDVWGVVEFDVRPPAVDVLKLELGDDGAQELQLSAQLAAEVPENDYTLTVQWPDSVTGEPGPTSTVELPCLRIDALGCSTVDTARFVDLEAALAYTLPLDADTTDPVEVTITDRFGGGLTRQVPIDSPDRPTLSPPRVAPSAEQPGIVAFDLERTTVQVPVRVDVDPNYELARIAPGTEGVQTNFGIVDPADGTPKTLVQFLDGAVSVSAGYDAANDEWALDLRVTAGLDDLGATTFAVVVQQNTGARTTLPLSLNLVPSQGDRFRAAVADEIDPLSFGTDTVPVMVPYVMGGRDEWGDYTGDLCVRVRDVAFPDPGPEQCATVADLLDDQGEFSPLDFSEYYPDGLRDNGGYEVTARIPGTERADATPFRTTFFMDGGPPTIDTIAWDRKSASVRFAVTPFDAETAIASYACRLNGEEVACPDAASGFWSGATLTAGSYAFELDVEDIDGNYTTASTSFELKKDVKVKPTKPPKGLTS